MQGALDRYHWLRFAVVVAVLLGTVGVVGAGGWVDQGATPVLRTAAVAAVVLAASTAWLRRASARGPIGALALYGQLALDVALASVLCRYTGGLASPLLLLYFPAIASAAYLLGMRGALVTAGFATAGFGVMLALTAEPAITPEARLGLYTDAMFRVFAFFLMAILTGRLAERAEATGRELTDVRRESALLASEHQLVLETIGSAVLTTDALDRVQTLNPAGRALLGAAVGHPLGEVLPGFAAVAGGAGRWEERRDDGQVWICTVSSLPGLGRVAVVDDVTEIERIREAAARDERLAMVGRFSGGVAHEIRNPLAALSGALQLLTEDPDPQLARIALDEATRLNRLVDDFLSALRPPSIHRLRTDLHALLERVADAFRADPQFRDRVRPRVLPGEAAAEVDPDRLRQVVWNLLLNGARAMPRGGDLELSVRPDAGDDGRPGVRLAVRDHGVGMSRDERERVFDPFYTTRSGGLGLGLVMVDQVVRLHGGTIRIESPPDGGTTFVIWLPEDAADAE